jgi:hypothetical protein
MNMFKVASLLQECPPTWEVKTWDIKQVLKEINRDHSAEFTDYDETDWKEGWKEWVDPTYTVMLQEYES